MDPSLQQVKHGSDGELLLVEVVEMAEFDQGGLVDMSSPGLLQPMKNLVFIENSKESIFCQKSKKASVI